MDVLEMTMPFEKHICAKADGLRVPIGATAELIPTCNMDCRMCYVRMSPEQMKKEGHLLSVEEWVNIIGEAQKQGLLFLLLTGGEPLLYPGFKTLYRELKKLGLIICINTNGTLINKDMADFLAEDPPRRVNISIYGASDERYGTLCNNPHGFSQMMQGVHLLKEREIAVKWNYSVTRLNVEDMDQIYHLAEENDIYVETAYYMFPPARKIDSSKKLPEFWLTAKETAKIRILAEIHDLGEKNFFEKCKVVKALSDGEIKIEKPTQNSSFTCRAGTSTFWFNWKGEMLSCGMIGTGEKNVMKYGFSECWKNLKKWTRSYKHPIKCTECQYETICVRCAAASYAEEQDFEKSPQYVCEVMEWYIKYIRKILEKKELPDGFQNFENTIK